MCPLLLKVFISLQQMPWSAIAWLNFVFSPLLFNRKLWSSFSKLLCCLIVLAVMCGQSSFWENQVGFDVGIFHFRHCERCVVMSFCGFSLHVPGGPRGGCQPSFLLFVSCALLLKRFPVSVQACPGCLSTLTCSQGNQSFYTSGGGGQQKKVAHNG